MPGATRGGRSRGEWWEYAAVAVGGAGVLFGLAEWVFTSERAAPYIVGIGAFAMLMNCVNLLRQSRRS